MSGIPCWSIPPLVRNRLTLMRTRRMMKLDEINNVIHI